jgi:hypothetical protein
MANDAIISFHHLPGIYHSGNVGSASGLQIPWIILELRIPSCFDMQFTSTTSILFFYVIFLCFFIYLILIEIFILFGTLSLLSSLNNII